MSNTGEKKSVFSTTYLVRCTMISCPNNVSIASTHYKVTEQYFMIYHAYGCGWLNTPLEMQLSHLDKSITCHGYQKKDSFVVK